MFHYRLPRNRLCRSRQDRNALIRASRYQAFVYRRDRPRYCGVSMSHVGSGHQRSAKGGRAARERRVDLGSCGVREMAPCDNLVAEGRDVARLAADACIRHTCDLRRPAINGRWRRGRARSSGNVSHMGRGGGGRQQRGSVHLPCPLRRTARSLAGWQLAREKEEQDFALFSLVPSRWPYPGLSGQPGRELSCDCSDFKGYNLPPHTLRALPRREKRPWQSESSHSSL
jgi:hypothetical protein